MLRCRSTSKLKYNDVIDITVIYKIYIYIYNGFVKSNLSKTLKFSILKIIENYF